MELGSVFQELNRLHFQNGLPQPRLSWNSRLRSSAGRFHPGSRNPLRPREPMIEIASYLLKLSDGAVHIQDTMLHEMVHYHLWFQKKPYGHTPEFHTILKRVGARRYNPVPKESAVKHWYECPNCLAKSPARRKLGNVACLTCCKKWNRGKYSERYRLREAAATQLAAIAQVKPIVDEKKEKVLPFSEVLRHIEEIREILKKKSPDLY